MQTVADTRRHNLDLLAAEAHTLDEVAVRGNCSPIYLSQIRNQTRDAKTGRPRAMGDRLARRLEEAFGKDKGWMDEQHLSAGEAPKAYRVAQDLSHAAFDTVPLRGLEVPVIGTLEMGQGNEFTLRARPDGQAIGAVPGHALTGDMFSVRVEGDELYPAVRHGACLIIDPAARCESGELALVEMTDGTFIVAELVAHRADSLTIAPVQGGRRTTYAGSEVVRVQAVVSVVAGSQFRPIGGA